MLTIVSILAFGAGRKPSLPMAQLIYIQVENGVVA